MARPTLDQQIRKAAEAAGWRVEHVVRGVLLLARSDVDVDGGPPVPVTGRRLTIIVARRREGFSPVQSWFLQGEDVLVVDAASLHLLALVLEDETSDRAALAELALEPVLSEPYDAPNRNGVRPKRRPSSRPTLTPAPVTLVETSLFRLVD